VHECARARARCVCVHYVAIYTFFFALAAMIVTCEADEKTIERNNIIMNI